MVRQLLLLTTAVVASLGQTDKSTCGALSSTDGKCQNDTAILFQVASPKHQKDGMMTSMSDWHSSRDLARVGGLPSVTISPNNTLQIFTAVPVFGEDENYIALLVEHPDGDAWAPGQETWAQDFDTFVIFCAGPDGSHKTQMIARGHSWVCPWPREELESKQFKVFLEDTNGTNLGMVLAEHDPKLLGHYKTMACVRDIFYVRDPKKHRPFHGPFKQWVEWVEWSSMHGLEHFLIYTFEGTDLAAKDLMKPYLDAGIASRVHFQVSHPNDLVQFGHLMNDCIYRAKNHAKWLATSVDVDEYMVFPGKVKYFDWDHILKEQGVLEDKVASLQLRRVRFARARPEFFEISSDHREPTLECCWPKHVINVDKVYRTSIHRLKDFKAGTATIRVDPKLAIIRHYRLPKKNSDYGEIYMEDPAANMTDETLQKEIPMLEAAIATRFNIQAADVKVFLKTLAQRRPPDTDTAAHKMQ